MAIGKIVEEKHELEILASPEALPTFEEFVKRLGEDPNLLREYHPEKYNLFLDLYRDLLENFGNVYK